MSNGTELYANQQNLSLGDILRKRREELHLSLEDVSQNLRIRLTFLKALEEGHIDQLPGIAYASGFIRAYAEFLDLDVEEIVKRFRAEHQATEYQQKLLFPAPVPQSGVPAAVIIFVGFIIIVGGYIGWYKMTDHVKAPAETIPSIAGKTEANSDHNKISLQIASVMPVQHPDHSKPDENVKNEMNKLETQIAQSQKTSDHIPPSSQPTPLVNQQNSDKDLSQNTSPAKTEVTGIDSSKQPQDMSIVKKEANISEQKADVEQPQSVKETGIVIKASEASWLKVQDQNGHILLQKTLQAGDQWAIPKDQVKVSMTIGNAGAVTIEQNGKVSKPLGTKGKVLRHFVITPEVVTKLLIESSVNGSGMITKTPVAIGNKQIGNKDSAHQGKLENSED